MPPPMHKVASPFFASRFCISCSSVTKTRAPEAPIGWPRAMAPPLTLTLEVSQARSLLTAQAWAAKASLASTRSRSEAFQPAFFSASAAGRDRPGAHDRRIDAGGGPGNDAGQRLDAAPLGFGRGHQHDRGGAVIDAGGVAGGDRAVLVEGRAQLHASVSMVVPCLGYSSVIDDDLALARGDLHRDDFVLEPAGLLRRFGLVLRLALRRESILLLAR